MSAKTSYLVPLIKTVEIYFKQNKQSINEKVLSHDHGDGATKKSTLFKDQLKKNIFFFDLFSNNIDFWPEWIFYSTLWSK